MNLRFLMIMSTLVIFSACGEDEGEEVTGEPLIGTYKISSAILIDEVTTSIETAYLEAGSNITTAIVNAFLGEIDCFDKSAKGIQLAEENKIFYTCLSEELIIEKGSWSITEDRSELTLTLNINSQIVPLVLINLNEFDGGVSGIVASIPVPPALLSFVNGEFIKVQDPAVLISLELTFSRV